MTCEPATKIVLVVEDNADLRLMLVEVLLMEGFLVASAACGNDGVARIAELPEVSVVLLDLSMPGSDGFVVLNAGQRAAPGTTLHDVPIIVVSALANPRHARQNGYVRKPFDAKTVLDAVWSKLPPAPLPAAPHDSQHLSGTETILLVEDDDSVRGLAKTLLQRLGYCVLEADCGADAVKICESHAARIDLLCTDVVMPAMNGRELAELLAPMRPHMRVLYMSGYTTDEVLHRGIATATVSFLQKPFEPGQFALRIRAALDAPAPS